jgi:hypothetical protein
MRHAGEEVHISLRQWSLIGMSKVQEEIDRYISLSSSIYTDPDNVPDVTGLTDKVLDPDAMCVFRTIL